MSDERLANPELAECEVDGLSRSSFLLRGALAAGAVYGTAAVAPFVSSALAQGDAGDAEILNFALTLEYLESDFYNVKGRQVGLSGSAKSYATLFGEQESQHVQALSAAIKQLGGKPIAKPTFVFPVTNEKTFLALASVLEEHRRRRLQRGGTVAEEQAGAGRGRRDRADRGPARRRRRPADR